MTSPPDIDPIYLGIDIYWHLIESGRYRFLTPKQVHKLLRPILGDEVLKQVEQYFLDMTQHESKQEDSSVTEDDNEEMLSPLPIHNDSTAS
jgi:hypothetical protein